MGLQEKQSGDSDNGFISINDGCWIVAT